MIVDHLDAKIRARIKLHQSDNKNGFLIFVMNIKNLNYRKCASLFVSAFHILITDRVYIILESSMMSYPVGKTAVLPFGYLQPTKINFPSTVYWILSPYHLKKKAIFGEGKTFVVRHFI